MTIVGRRRVAIRVDANADIGIGHLRRCLTLGAQLRVDGFDVRLITGSRLGPSIEKLCDGLPIFVLDESSALSASNVALADERQDAEQTLAVIGNHPSWTSWVVVDHYGLSEPWEQIVRAAGHQILAIDDYRDRRHCADIIVSDSNTPFDPGLNGGRQDCLQLVGNAYALIDSAFAYRMPRHLSESHGIRCLVAYGGSDPTNETAKALEAIHLARQEERDGARIVEADVVIGPANFRRDELIRLASQMGGTKVHVGPPTLASLMHAADVVLAAGGNSMVEALALRLPCLVTITSDNQRIMVAELARRQAIIVLGDHTEVRATGISKALARIVANYRQVAERAREQAIFDHLGAQRISKAMCRTSGKRQNDSDEQQHH